MGKANYSDDFKRDAVFDTNGDGELSGAELADFRIMVTNADGSTMSHTLTELGITSINLTAGATQIELPDGVMITGRTEYARGGDRAGVHPEECRVRHS